MVAHDHPREFRVGRAELFNVGELGAKRINPVRNQREQDAIRVVREQTVDRSGQRCVIDIWLLKINAVEAVDL